MLVSVLLLEKAHVRHSGALAMGMDGVNNAVLPGRADPEQYVAEITLANDGIVNQRTIWETATRGFGMIKRLEGYGVKFDKAFVFDAETLHALPVVRIRPTLEYDAKPHSLAGPLLTSVLEAAGVPPGGDASLLLRAVDGYAVPITLADARAYRMIVATEMDGAALVLGSLGPQWAIHDADSLAAHAEAGADGW